MSRIIIQNNSSDAFVPSDQQLKRVARLVLAKHRPMAEVTIRIVDAEEILALNSEYRHKNKVTDVLSFPMDWPEQLSRKIIPIGDIVICATVVKEEADAMQKPVLSHFSHMVVHGILHLLGYDHENDRDATRMEREEIALLQELSIDNPYEDEGGS